MSVLLRLLLISFWLVVLNFSQTCPCDLLTKSDRLKIKDTPLKPRGRKCSVFCTGPKPGTWDHVFLVTLVVVIHRVDCSIFLILAIRIPMHFCRLSVHMPCLFFSLLPRYPPHLSFHHSLSHLFLSLSLSIYHLSISFSLFSLSLSLSLSYNSSSLFSTSVQHRCTSNLHQAFIYIQRGNDHFLSVRVGNRLRPHWRENTYCHKLLYSILSSTHFPTFDLKLVHTN